VNDVHVVELPEEGGYSITHSVLCRARGTIHDCPLDADARIWSQTRSVVPRGRFAVTPNGGGGWDMEEIDADWRPELSGAERILAERVRQLDEEGFTDWHDDAHFDIAPPLAYAAVAYIDAGVAAAITGVVPSETVHPRWPWSPDAWKPDADPVRNLEKAGALIAPKIDRLRGSRPPEVVHRTPPGDEALTPCCHRSPLELPRRDRMTNVAELVTCRP
jgi:hypothetical protein